MKSASLKKSDLAVVWRKVDELIPYARNARTHSEEQVAQIAASIKEFGFTNPILTDSESGVVAGHGRLLAARKLGLEKVPTIRLDGLSKTQIRAYVLADNRLALNAGWDDKLLALELGDLKEEDFDLGIAGFSTKELNDIFSAEAELSPEPMLDGLEYKIVIDCDNEIHQTQLLERFDQEGLKCRPLMS